MQPKLPEVLRSSPWWDRIAAVGSLIAVALLTWLVTRWIARRLHGKTPLRLHGLDRLAAPTSMLVAVAFAHLGAASSEEVHPLVDVTLQLLAVGGGFWFAARCVDVMWRTGRHSARLRHMPGAGTMLLAGRRLGKLALAVTFAAVIAVRLGAAEQVYLVLGALTAALAFAARDPLRSAVSFAAMVVDPPFHIGDRVRLVAFRGGEEVLGEVIEISLFSTTVRTRQHTLVVVSNLSVGQLRVENLSAADRRRLELVVTIPEELSADALRALCDELERELAESPHVAAARAPRVWIAGLGEGLRLKASVWLHRAADRRDAQRDLLLAVHARIQARIEAHERER